MDMKYLACVTAILLFCGCGTNHRPEKIVAKVGEYTITQDEFEEAFQLSRYSKDDTPQLRETFLNNMINEKLIVLDAQARGLDKSDDFLSMIQQYWEQSLITMAVRAKAKEFSKGAQTKINPDQLNAWIEQLRNKTSIEIHTENIKAGL